MFEETLAKKTFLWIVLVSSVTLVHLGYSENVNIMDLAFKNEISTDVPLTRSVLPIESKVTFYLYTRQNIVKKLKLNEKSFDKSNFMVGKPTKFIIHGYFDNVYSTMPQGLKNNLLLMEDVNVIIVDWGAIAIGLNYMHIASETPNVGQYLANLMDFLVLRGCDPESFHLIGHSLGAHIAGFAGAAMITGKPGRISGLDPAKPEFHNSPPEKRLDPTDANFVDCIHTCGGLLGLMEPICHVDFYPNGGTNTQPGCHFYDFGRCSHVRSHLYYSESILGHSFDAFQCENYSTKITHKHCTGVMEQMGYHTSRSARGVFYTKTNKMFPFGVIKK